MNRDEAFNTFTLERSIAAEPARIWHALTDPRERARWFSGEDDWVTAEESHDLTIGSGAVLDGHWHGGPRTRFSSTYTDIVELERLVYTYDMWLDDRHLSTSITAIVLDATDDGTLLTYTEQGVHLDGLDTPDQREAGTRALLDALQAVCEA
jgi:uncharacterized protein YndB with AHSA1/START domain